MRAHTKRNTMTIRLYAVSVRYRNNGEARSCGYLQIFRDQRLPTIGDFSSGTFCGSNAAVSFVDQRLRLPPVLVIAIAIAIVIEQLRNFSSSRTHRTDRVLNLISSFLVFQLVSTSLLYYILCCAIFPQPIAQRPRRSLSTNPSIIACWIRASSPDTPA